MSSLKQVNLFFLQTDSPRKGYKIKRRRDVTKRHVTSFVSDRNEIRSNNDSRISSGVDEMDCGPTQCTYISCTVGPLGQKEHVTFKIRSRLWTTTLSKLTHHQYEISSRMVARVSQLPHGVDPTYLGFKTFTVTSRVISINEYADGGDIPIWILLLAILAGLLFLAILSFFLWHFGFFRRRRVNRDELNTADTPTEGVVLLHEKPAPSKVAMTTNSNAVNGNNHTNGYVSMPGDSASIASRAARNSHSFGFSTTDSNSDHQSLLSSYPPGILQPGDEVL